METQKKSKTQLYKELQDVVDKFQEKKHMVNVLLEEIDDLAYKYNIIRNEIKK
jgi:hypothetical protein